MKKVLFLSLFVFLGILLFYWFQWRPMEIRKQCRVKANEAKESDLILALIPSAKVPDEEKNNIYRECLAKNGMKPESLFVNLPN